MKGSTHLFAGLLGLVLLPGSVLAVSASQKSSASTELARRRPKGVKITPKKLDFHIVPIGERRTEIFSIENFTADTVLVQLEEPPDPFRIPANILREFNVIPGNRISVPVEYVSTDEGRHTGNLTIITSDLRRPTQTVALKGRGGPISNANVDLRPEYLDFGTTEPREGTPQVITIENFGKSPRDVILEIGKGYPDFHIGGAEDLRKEKITLAGGQTVTRIIGFHPKTVGRYQGSLLLTVTNAGDHPRTLPPVRMFGRCQKLSD